MKQKILQGKPVAALAMIFFLAQTAPSHSDDRLFQFRETAMGTSVLIQVYAGDRELAASAANRALVRIRKLEEIFSDYNGTSEVLQFCHEPPGTLVKLSPELHDILKKSQKLAVETDGAFDVTIGTLVHTWRRSRRDRELPGAKDLQRAFQGAGFKHLQLHPDKAGEIAIAQMRINLGGIAKGYAADEALRVMREAGFPRSVVAVSGDIAVGEAPPGKSGWRIGITSLASPDQPDRFVRIAKGAVSTSGDTRQSLKIGNVRYSHILDPSTGLGLTERRSVSVIAPNATIADSLATALCVLGSKTALLKKYPGSSARLVEVDAEIFLEDFETYFVSKVDKVGTE